MTSPRSREQRTGSRSREIYWPATFRRGNSPRMKTSGAQSSSFGRQSGPCSPGRSVPRPQPAGRPSLDHCRPGGGPPQHGCRAGTGRPSDGLARRRSPYHPPAVCGERSVRSAGRGPGPSSHRLSQRPAAHAVAILYRASLRALLRQEPRTAGVVQAVMRKPCAGGTPLQASAHGNRWRFRSVVTGPEVALVTAPAQAPAHRHGVFRLAACVVPSLSRSSSSRSRPARSGMLIRSWMPSQIAASTSLRVAEAIASKVENAGNSSRPPPPSPARC